MQALEILKSRLLDLTVRGKITQQPEDGPAISATCNLPSKAPFDIPKNWKWARMSDVLTKLTDGVHKTPKYVAQGIPFLTVKNINSGVIDFSHTKFITQQDFEILRKRCNPEKGDLLVSKDGTTGIPAIVEDDKEFGLFVTVALLKPNRDLIRSDFLYYLILSPLVQMQVKENVRGVALKHWVLKDIAKTLIVLPPLNEQKRIVEKLDRLFSKIDVVQKSMDEVSHIGKSLEKNLLQSAIGGKLVPQLDEEPIVEQIGEAPENPLFKVPEKWKWVRSTELLSLVRGVTFPAPAKQASKIDDSYVRCLTTGSVQEEYKSDSDVFIPSAYIKKGKQRLKKGDIVISSANSRDLVGKSILWNGLDYTFGGFLTVARGESRLILPDYLHLVFRFFFLSGFFRTFATQTTNIANLSNKILEALFIPLPPVGEQQRIVDKLDKLMFEIQKMK